MKPTLDPKRDLRSATPEKLARALLKQPELRPRPAGRAVVRDQVAVEKVPADRVPNHRVPHVRKRS